MTQSANPEPLPREQLRASDADRQATVDRLRRAHDDGRLSLAEYDERVQGAYAARTYADLARLTVDLPDSYHPVVPAAPPVSAPASVAAGAPAVPEASSPPAKRGDTGWRVAVTTWAAASVINFVIWALVCIGNAELIYPWWIWVAGPWGAVMLVIWLIERAESKDD